MNATTRINRPTYHTPHGNGAPRYFHVSTNYAWVPVDFTNPAGRSHFVRVGKGSTYRSK